MPELEIDPGAELKMLDFGDVDFPFGDIHAANNDVQAAISEVVAAGCLPVTTGGNAPAYGFAVINGITAQRLGSVGGSTSMVPATPRQTGVPPRTPRSGCWPPTRRIWR
jgi:hypothetical protein